MRTLRGWIRENIEAHGIEWVRDNYDAACDAFGEQIGYETWTRALRKIRAEMEAAGKGTDLGDELQSHEVDTEGKAELFHGVDPARWKARRMRVNTWGSESNPNKQVRIEFDPRDTLTPEQFADRVMASLATIKPRYPKLKRPERSTGLTAEVMAPDLHIGSPAWGDAASAREQFTAAIATLMRPYRSGEFARILFPVGNDFLNYDGWNLATTAGTQQETSDRPDIVISEAQRALIEAIDYLVRFGDVDVVVIPGNHDWILSHMLGRILEAWYREAPHVTVDTALDEWKFRTGPAWLLGLTHGKHPDTRKGLPAERLAQLLPLLAPQQWAASTYREVQTGHYHTKSGSEFPKYRDVDGVMVRRVASLAPHSERERAIGYMSGREAELLILDDRHVVETRSYRP